MKSSRTLIRMPAEWEPHAATYLAWPNNSRDWPGKFSAARWAWVEFIRHLSSQETVRLAVQHEGQAARVARILKEAHVDGRAVDFRICPLDRGWMRDISPFYVYDGHGRRRAVRFGFTGWAKYANHRLDAGWAPLILSQLRIPTRVAALSKRPVILEGGAVDVNGKGALLATEECLLDEHCQVRNPGFTRKTYESLFYKHLGITHVIWLNAGIAGDDTHGHIDDICRFVAPDTVVLCREPNPRDGNYAVLEENYERLQRAKTETGASLNIVSLPMPAPLYFRGVRLPASYANFYIANELVLAPTFNDDQDRIALGILAELFPDRRVIGIHAVELVWGLGTLHCLSHEEPKEKDGV